MPRIVSRTIALATLVLLSYYSTVWVNETDTRDLRIYLESATRLRQGLPLYDIRYTFPDRATHFELQYLYPPALAALLAPFAGVPFPSFTLVWQSGLVVAIVLTAWLLSRFVSACRDANNSASATAIFIMLAIWPPTLDGILWGQVNAYILFFLTASILAISTRRDSLGGLSLGISIALKGTPAILLVPLVIHKRWRALLFSGIGILVLHLPLLFYPNGLLTIPSFLRTMGEIAAGHVVNDPFYDYSLRRVITFFVDVPAPLFSAISLCLVVVYTLCIILCPRHWRSTDTQSQLLCSLHMVVGIPFMIMISPLIWFHHLLWLFPALSILIAVHPKSILSLGGRIMYLALAPLLYVHVYVRHFVDYGEGWIKPLPFIFCGITCYLLCKQIEGLRTKQSSTPPPPL